MMKFQNFEVLYGAACEIMAAAGENPVVAAAADRQKKVLLMQFSANFPGSLEEADAHPGFDVFQFIEMLIAFPETLKGKGEKLSALLADFAENQIEVPEELKLICEDLQEKPVRMSPEEKAIAEALKSEFPDSVEKLDKLPFTRDAVIDFLITHSDKVDGKRQPFMALLKDLSDHGVTLPEPLRRQWLAMVMEP